MGPRRKWTQDCIGLCVSLPLLSPWLVLLSFSNLQLLAFVESSWLGFLLLRHCLISGCILNFVNERVLYCTQTPVLALSPTLVSGLCD